MRVRVIRGWERVISGASLETRRGATFFVTTDKEYTVYGLSWHGNSNLFGQSVLVCEIVDDYGNLASVPIEIFDVTDSKIPEIWRVEKRDNAVFLWPEIFLKKFFFDDLSEGVPECVNSFQDVRKLLEGPSKGGGAE